AEDENAFYVTYRLRRPRGVEHDRGGEARIARLDAAGHVRDRAELEDLWSVTKERYGSASIERSAIRRGADGRWRYFTSYVDPTDGRWCVSVLDADRPENFDPGRERRLWSAGDLDLQSVKDPWLCEVPGGYAMFCSVALSTDATRSTSHA